ncbi:DNA/RNA non-specific endonuclease [Mucilaginibacter daejeonensis]|uniref:DNA/RNA non-specific endonuclease n=1 Tax=Mucilaginibacter daejeonensis TaxID=398049 RepID=UPI001D1725D2|nr:DNA/RNA non-specific endonuclease [Mucilaginibacter daejeonensis]UEG54718.1 DNA/RNA non-specific endonuclease [Mucilaginibacter daejeonensis]
MRAYRAFMIALKLLPMKRIIYLFAAWLLTGLIACNSNEQHTQQDSPTLPNGIPKQVSPILREGFETGAKPSYTAETIQLKSGRWYLKDALIAASEQDAKDGDHSVRIRNKGTLRMEQDVDGVSKVTIKHAAYAGNKTSAWQLQMSVDGGNTYTQVGASMVASTGPLQKVTFLVNHKGPIRFAIVKTSGRSNRINIDNIVLYGYDANAPIHTTGDTAAAAMTDSAVAGDNGDMLMGNPSNAKTDVKDPNNYLIERPYYTMSYNRSRSTPNWVSWYVGEESMGRAKRQNDFRPDDSLPKGWYRVQSNSYYGSGFERGHNCPSADRTSSVKANSATFLMSNMIPQAPANNEYTWSNLESYERLLVKKGNEVYVIMGSYGNGGYGTQGYHTTIDGGHIAVPQYIWKVLVVIPSGYNDLSRVNANTRVIAVITPNNNSVSPDWTRYLCTVRDIEKATGYDLLSKLPKAIQDAIETRKDAGMAYEDAYINRS